MNKKRNITVSPRTLRFIGLLAIGCVSLQLVSCGPDAIEREEGKERLAGEERKDLARFVEYLFFPTAPYTDQSWVEPKASDPETPVVRDTDPAIVHARDTVPPTITGATLSDGEKEVDPKAINSAGRIEVTFSEVVTGNITLRTAAGADVGWISTIQGKKGTLERVNGKNLDNRATYVIAGTVKDTAGNETGFNITFTTAKPAVIEVSDATFEEVVLGSEIPIVVEFYTDW